MKYSISLTCVYKYHEVIRNKHNFKVDRIIYNGKICGRKAPRNRGKLAEPAFPNRFGEPLCEHHKIWAQSEEAFPGPKPTTKYEEEKTGVGRLDRLKNFSDLVSFLEDAANEMDNLNK